MPAPDGYWLQPLENAGGALQVPQSWVLEGSNDGFATSDVLDTQLGVAVLKIYTGGAWAAV
jgi:hypothetical protein